jgi:hypothetical protein
MNLGIVTNVKRTEKDLLIDVLGIDGSYYTGVPVLNTTGLNEVPVPSDIRTLDAWNLSDPLLAELVGSMYDPGEAIRQAKIRTLVLYEEISLRGQDKRAIIPVRFLKNWPQESASEPPLRVKPQPGEIAIQAAGTTQYYGGYLYLRKDGSIKLSTGSSYFVLEAQNLTGETKIRAGSLHLDTQGINLNIEKNGLKLDHKMFLGTSYAPVPNATVSIDQTGKIDVTSSPVTGISSNVTITGDSVTVKSSTSGTSASVVLKGTGEVTIEGNTGASVKIKITSSGIEVDAGGKSVTVNNATDFKINATSGVVINNGTQAVVLADLLTTVLNSHIHSTPAGPSGPPMVQFNSTMYSSQSLKTT